MAKDGKPDDLAKEIIGEFAMQQSIVNLQWHPGSITYVLSPSRYSCSERGALPRQHSEHACPFWLDQKILDRLAIEAGTLFEKLELIKTFEKRKSLELELALAKTDFRPPTHFAGPKPRYCSRNREHPWGDLQPL